MSIEKYIPKEMAKSQATLIERVKNFLIKKEMGPVDETFYNADRSRSLVFREWRGENGFKQLNVRLNLKIDDAWMTKLAVMTRWSNDQEQLYGIELEAISGNKEEPPFKTFWFNRHQGGKGFWNGEMSALIKISSAEARSMAEELGIIKEEDVPQFIDFEKTATEFLIKARNLDFSDPILYEKELIP